MNPFLALLYVGTLAYFTFYCIRIIQLRHEGWWDVHVMEAEIKAIDVELMINKERTIDKHLSTYAVKEAHKDIGKLESRKAKLQKRIRYLETKK